MAEAFRAEIAAWHGCRQLIVAEYRNQQRTSTKMQTELKPEEALLLLLVHLAEPHVADQVLVVAVAEKISELPSSTEQKKDATHHRVHHDEQPERLRSCCLRG